MNRIYILMVSILVLSGVACQDADREMFPGEKSGVYFKLSNLSKDGTLIMRKDTVVYTFAYDDVEEVRDREICIPVELIGFATGTDRKYHVEVVAAGNTEEGVDYEPVESEQTFGANKTVDSLRVMWKRSESMQKEVKKLNIRIVSGGDFVAGVEEKLFVSLQVSDILEKPVWWDVWYDAFGSWHPTKLREWIRIWGREDLDADPWMIGFFYYPQECSAIIKLHDLFESKEFFDENGVRLFIPANIN